jgi:hypothetical protein
MGRDTVRELPCLRCDAAKAVRPSVPAAARIINS